MRRQLKNLKEEYLSVLEKMISQSLAISPEQDKYSGIFLSQVYENYFNSKLKVMVVGRETAGWNTDNGKGGISHLINNIESGNLINAIDDSLERYSKFYYHSAYGAAKKKSKSHFIRFFRKIATELGVPVDGIVYSNMLAWDYNKNSFKSRPIGERAKLEDISLELMAVQVKSYQPDIIIFATGSMGYIDPMIKKLAKEFFTEHKTISVVRKKIWKFNIGDIKCYRIAHPRAQNGEHPKYRDEVIQALKTEFAFRDKIA